MKIFFKYLAFAGIMLLAIATIFEVEIYAEQQAEQQKESFPIYGSQSMTDPLLKVLVKRPDQAFAITDPVKWHYTSSPNLALAQIEHDKFVNIIAQQNIEVHYHDEHLPNLADAIFVHDPAIITKKGAVILRMGKTLRRGEEEALEKKLNSMGIPSLCKLKGDAMAEGGDTLWLNEKTLAIGCGFRTNREGIKQIRKGLSELQVKIITVDLPYCEGEDSCLHLQSLISLVDEKVALVYLPYLPVSFVEILKAHGFKLIEVPLQEFATMGPNVLTLSPGLCLTMEGNPITKKRLEEAGLKVITYKGDEISLRTCLKILTSAPQLLLTCLRAI